MSSTGTIRLQRVARADQAPLAPHLVPAPHRRERVVNHVVVAAPVRHLARVERADQAHID